MNKKYAKVKSTRRSLMMSVLSLMLSVAMLLGTTYAWFTDSVTSGTNRIVSGNLDVEMYYKNVNTEKQTGDDKWANVATADADPRFFVDSEGNDILWEPGVVSVCDFEVRNVGNLALKYKFETTTDATKTPDGEHDLTEVIKAAVVPFDTDVSTREAAIAAGDGKWADINTFKANGALVAGADPDQFKVILYWAPNDNAFDNIFNMNNENKGKELDIKVDIKLVATQLADEDDSFDSLYDVEAYVEGWTGSLNGNVKSAPAVKGQPVVVEMPGIKVTIPKDVVTEGKTVTLKVKDSVPAQGITISDGQYEKSYDIELVNEDGNKISTTKKLTVEMPIATNLTNVTVYHKGAKLTKTTYDPLTGLTSFSVTDFCPVSIVYSEGIKVSEDGTLEKFDPSIITKTGEVKLDEEVQTINSNAFGDAASKIKNLETSATTIADGAFEGAVNLEKVTVSVPEGKKVVVEESIFDNAAKVTELTINGDAELDNYALYDEYNSTTRREITFNGDVEVGKHGLSSNGSGHPSDSVVVFNGNVTFEAESIIMANAKTYIFDNGGIVKAPYRSFGMMNKITVIFNEMPGKGSKFDLGMFGDSNNVFIKVPDVDTFMKLYGKVNGQTVELDKNGKFSKGETSGWVVALDSGAITTVDDQGKLTSVVADSVTEGKLELSEEIKTIEADAIKEVVNDIVEIKTSATEIGEEAFNGAEKLEKVTVTVPEGEVLTIAENAFANCENLKTFEIQGDVSLGADSFICGTTENAPIVDTEFVFDGKVTVGKEAFCTNFSGAGGGKITFNDDVTFVTSAYDIPFVAPQVDDVVFNCEGKTIDFGNGPCTALMGKLNMIFEGTPSELKGRIGFSEGTYKVYCDIAAWKTAGLLDASINSGDDWNGATLLDIRELPKK